MPFMANDHAFRCDYTKTNIQVALAYRRPIRDMILVRPGGISMDEIYSDDMGVPDIPMYLAILFLIREGIITGPCPYSALWPVYHPEMIYYPA